MKLQIPTLSEKKILTNMSSCHPSQVILPSRSSDFRSTSVMLMTVTTITVHPSFPSRATPIIFTFHILKNNYFLVSPSSDCYPIAFTSSPQVPSDAIHDSIDATDSHVMEFQIPITPGLPVSWNHVFKPSCLQHSP